MRTSDPVTGAIPRSRSRAWIAAAAALIAAAAVAWALWMYFGRPNIGQYAPVIEQINSGQLQADHGIIDVTRSFPGLSPNGQIYLTRRPDGSYVALFPTHVGKAYLLDGLLYSSRPLTDRDTYSASLGTTVDRRFIDVGARRRMTITDRLGEHWYRVSHAAN